MNKYQNSVYFAVNFYKKCSNILDTMVGFKPFSVFKRSLKSITDDNRENDIPEVFPYRGF